MVKMAEVYKPKIPAGAKRGATLLAHADRLGGGRAGEILDQLDAATVHNNAHTQTQALKANHLDGLSQLTVNLIEKTGKASCALAAMVLASAAASFGISIHETLHLIKEGQLSGAFSTGSVVAANVVAAGLLGSIAVEGVAGALRDLLTRDPDVASAYDRLRAGAKPVSDRVFSRMTPDEREKAKHLVSLMSQLHSGNTPMLQADIRSLVDTLNATNPQSFDSELQLQIDMVRQQLSDQKQDFEAPTETRLNPSPAL